MTANARVPKMDLLGLVLCLLLMPGFRAEASAESTVTEVDLVFPRANETYQRVYPFPIVFAIQNPAPVWPHNFQLFWQTGSVVDDEPPRFDCNRLPARGAELWTSGSYKGTGLLNKIYAAEVYMNNTIEKWYLAWHITMIRNCTDDRNGVALSPRRPEAEGKIYFTFNRDGKLPDIVQAKESAACPLPVWTVNIVDVLDSHVARNQSQYGDKTNSMCPVFDVRDPHPSPRPCEAKPTEELARNVSREMLSTAKCAGVHSWPNASLVGRCNDTNWGAASMAAQLGPSTLGVVALTAILLGGAFISSVRE
ncbi:hypothetical protein NOR_03933 [Metarhizium rileyi]|uniref:DUF7136 domain-containing protein n=1 Tax=Metarhizium rileyi (strain RCEF 4871) TaxID=1649241 RepID=A0A167ENM5_METRR|nr:hypothetical protein NOR_03933 [Metarhizium rileyi RCEF 4871]